MEAKLTLKLDRDVIQKARKYAALQHRSLSGIIESYLQSLNSTRKASAEEDIEISDFVKSMSTPTGIPVDLDYKMQYLDHLGKKYQ